MVKGELAVAVVVGAACRSAGSVTAFAAIAANAGSAGNLLFPTDPAFGQRQRTRETPLVRWRRKRWRRKGGGVAGGKEEREVVVVVVVVVEKKRGN